jgi:hypothetical protein
MLASTNRTLDRLTGVVDTLASTGVAHDHQIEALIKIAEKDDGEMRERDRLFDERIAKLVSAIGELIRGRNGKS